MNTLSFLSRLLTCSLALAAFGVASLRGAEENTATWSDSAAEYLPKLDVFQKDKTYGAAVVFLDEVLKKSVRGSYDEVMFLQFKAKFLLMDNKLNEAVQPFERSLEFGEAKKFLKIEDIQWTRFYLSQIYFQQGLGKGIGVKAQKALFTKAASAMKLYQENQQRFNQDAAIFYANVLYNLAMINTEVEGKIDPEYVEKSRVVVADALTRSAKPKDTLYLLMVAVLQQQSKYAEATDYLEAVVHLNPSNKTYWQQLFATYYQLGSDAKDTKTAFDFNLRAILTMDRAQKLGFMKEQKDNFNRVGIYFNIQQFEKATDLLNSGLRDGSIEDNQKNWEILAYSFQQIKKEDKAIETLREAARRYPTKGQIHFAIAQNFYNLDKPKEAYEAAARALQVGNLDKPYMVHSFSAYMAFELRLFDEALASVTKALDFPESKKDKQLSQLKKAIEDSVQEREINRRAIETQHKNR